MFPGSKIFLLFPPPAGAGTHKRIGTNLKLLYSKVDEKAMRIDNFWL